MRFKYLYILSFLIFQFNCNQENDVKTIEKVFKRHKEQFEELKRSFTLKDNKLSVIWLDHKNVIRLRTSDGKFISLKKFRDSDEFNHISQKQIQLFKDLQIQSLKGYKTDISMKFLHIDACLNFVGSDTFDADSEENKVKTQNYLNGEKTNWIYILNDRWYIRTSCD